PNGRLGSHHRVTAAVATRLDRAQCRARRVVTPAAPSDVAIGVDDKTWRQGLAMMRNVGSGRELCRPMANLQGSPLRAVNRPACPCPRAISAVAPKVRTESRGMSEVSGPTGGPRRAGLVLAALILAAAVANLNLAVANVALPSIGIAFEASRTALDLVAVGY